MLALRAKLLSCIQGLSKAMKRESSLEWQKCSFLALAWPKVRSVLYSLV